MSETLINRWRWRDVPIRTKLTASFAILVGVVSAFIYLYFPAQFEHQSKLALVDESMTVAQMTAYSIGAAVYFNDAKAGQEVLSGMGVIEDVAYVVVSDTNGQTFASYNRADSTGATTADQALDDRTLYPVRVDVAFEGKVVGSLNLGHSLRHLQNEVRNARTTVTLVSLLIFLCGMGGAVVFSRILTNPLRRISEVAVEIAQGDLRKRAPVEARDEVGVLAKSFNQMLDSLHDAQGQLEELNRNLESRVVERTRELRGEVLERRAAEEALKKSEKLLRSIYDTVGDVLFLIDVDPGGEFRFASVNAAFSSTTKLPNDAVEGKLVREVIPEPSLTLVLERYRRSIQDRAIVRWEETTDYPAGRLIGAVSVAPIFDKSGNCTHLIGAVHDITARKLAEEALEKQRQFLRHVIDSDPNRIFSKDSDGRYTMANSAMAQFYGTTVEEIIGKGDSEFSLSADELLQVREADQAVLDEGRALFIPEQHLTDAQGRRRWYQTIRLPLQLEADTSGQTQVLGVAVEITARKEAEEALDKERLFLRRVIDTDPNFVFTKNREGRFTMVNAALAKAYGTTVAELVGKSDADFNDNAEEVRRFREDDCEVIDRQKEKLVPEEPITDAQGRTRWLQTIKRPLGKDPEGQDLLLGVATDITARKLAEDALRQSEEQLRQAVKMEAVGRLAGGVAHDFNNLLAVIIGQTELTRARMGADHPLDGCLAAIDDAAQRAADLTQQLLAFSRKQVLEPKIIDLNQIVAGTEKMLQRVIGEDIELVSSLAPNLWTVMGDRGQLQQVVMNLVINARDAMPQGGTLTILTSNIVVTQERVAASGTAAPGDYVGVTVQDTGVGMDKGTVARIFEPFFTTKGLGKGTGLGLSTVFGIVEQSHGYIDVESSLGQGTTFQIYLPRAEAAIPAQEAEAVTSSPKSDGGQAETILLVEDELDVRDMLCNMLGLAGYHVLVASNGQDALSLLALPNRTIDLLITDIIMPGMSGVELAAKARQTSPKTRILFMSGYTHDVLAQGGALDEETLLLQKPFRMDVLKQTVRAALERERSSTPTATRT
jgi:PAS domain S-box-containing protein